MVSCVCVCRQQRIVARHALLAVPDRYANGAYRFSTRRYHLHISRICPNMACMCSEKVTRKSIFRTMQRGVLAHDRADRPSEAACSFPAAWEWIVAFVLIIRSTNFQFFNFVEVSHCLGYAHGRRRPREYLRNCDASGIHPRCFGPVALPFQDIPLVHPGHK